MARLIDDIYFIAASFYSNIFSNISIYEIANHLNNNTYDDILAKIIANGVDNNNKKLFEKYFDAHGIKISDPKRVVAAKVFYHILHDRIDFREGIIFLHHRVVDRGNTTEYLGDDIGIEGILGKFYQIDDGDLSDEKYIKTAIEDIISDMKQYINDHLEKFPMDNNILKYSEKIVINKESEKKVKEKALAKGIEAKNREEVYRLRRLTIEIFENIKKLDSKILPKNEKELAGLIKTIINKSDNEIDKIIEEMFYIKKIIYEENNKIKFNLE